MKSLAAAITAYIHKAIGFLGRRNCPRGRGVYIPVYDSAELQLQHPQKFSGKVYIGLGSNLANPLRQINTALKKINSLPHTALTRVSSLYCSAPLGPIDQPTYVNAVARIDTKLRPEELLEQLLAIEKQQGRIRKERWGPRTLDLDILLYDNLNLTTPLLSIPHPQLVHRNFVVIPLLEINPDLTLPDGTQLAAQLTTISSVPLLVKIKALNQSEFD